MRRTQIAFLTVAVALSACGGKDDDGSDGGANDGGADDGTDGGDDGGNDDGGDGTDGGDGGDDGAGDDGSGDDGDGSDSFLGDPDGGDGANECDVFAQDCPDGSKCMPWANDGGNSWNATKCSPVDEDPVEVGDTCVVVGSGVSGEDNCVVGAMCYNVDPASGEGVCYEICGGEPMNATCDGPGKVCAIYNDGVLPLCYDECDPLLQDCPGMADLCLPSPNGNAFVCILDSLPNDDGGYGIPCEFANSCDPGLFCGIADIVPDCTGSSGCCSEFCDLTSSDPDAECSGQADGQTCQPWWGEETPPPGYEHVGFCGLPL